jgi:hypothetical protein
MMNLWPKHPPSLGRQEEEKNEFSGTSFPTPEGGHTP